MRARWLLTLGGFAAMLLAGGIGAVWAFPQPRTEVQAIAFDGHGVAAAGPVPTVSPRPHLKVQLNRPVAARQWQVVIDGEALPLQRSGTPLRQLELTLPGPLGLGSHHRLHLTVGRARLDLDFEVVPPLQASLEMRLHRLEADTPASVLTTVHFSRPVADQASAQTHLRLTGGNTTYSWPQPQTLQALTAAVPLGGQVVADLDEGIEGPDGSFTRGFKSLGLLVPANVTTVPPDRLVQMYYVSTPEARAAFFAHLDQISMLSPGWYEAGADGALSGSPQRDIIAAARARGVQVVPLVVNADIDQGIAHALLEDPSHRAALIDNLVAEARRYGYSGFQLDFEHLRWGDRDLYTALVEESAQAFKKAQLSLSVAVIPRLRGDDAAQGSLLDYFRNWSGAYDYVGLARAADFLSIMTYDEHNGVTPPGPVAGIPWMRKALDFTLQGVPAEKATLGLPTYYHDWIEVGRLTSSSYEDALILARRYQATPIFDPVEDEMHFTYQRYGVQHELWYETGETLRRKLPLMHEYGLRGISVWRLGLEDSAFWNHIPARH